MKVKDVMITSVVMAPSSILLRDLWKLIVRKRTNCALLLDEKKHLEGILVREDFLTLMFPTYDEFISDFESAADFEKMENHVRSLGNKLAKDVMIRRIIFTHENTELMRALSRMIVHRIDQLPVVSHDNKPLGLLKKKDIFSRLFKIR